MNWPHTYLVYIFLKYILIKITPQSGWKSLKKSNFKHFEQKRSRGGSKSVFILSSSKETFSTILKHCVSHFFNVFLTLWEALQS